MKWLKRLIFAAVLVCVGDVCSSDAIKIVGSNVGNDPPVVPTGLCGGSFTMSSDGFFSTATDSTNITIGIGALENSFSGKGYVVLGNAAALTTQLYKFDLVSLVQDAVVTIDTNPNNPDNVTSLISSYYDTNASRMVVVGNTTATTCTGSTQGCVHLRTYNGVTNVVDSVTSSGTENAAPAPAFGSAFDSTRVWVPYRVTPAGTQRLGEYSGFLLSKTLILTATSNYMSGLSTDSTYIYIAQAVGPQVNRIPKSDITTGFSGFAPGYAASATNILSNVTADESAGWLYVVSQSKGVTSNFVYRVVLSTLVTINSTLTLGATQVVGKVLVDSVNNKLYVAINSGGSAVQVIRLNRTTFASEATYNGGTSAGGVRPENAQIDVYHQKIYFPIMGTGGGGVAKVEKINLCA